MSGRSPSELLARVLSLIEQDIERISESLKYTDDPVDGPLTRYARSLVDISTVMQEAEERKKDQLEQMTPEELRAKAEAILAQTKKENR